MANVKCPICGSDNPEGASFCQNCGNPLKKADASTIQPGDQPTKKNTAELEPILPDWLRDARDKARKSVEEEVQQRSENTRPVTDSNADLLAGLQSQSADDEEEIPDWLAGITGGAGKKKVQPEEPAEPPTESRFVEVGRLEDYPPSSDSENIQATQPSSDSDSSNLPSWLQNITAGHEIGTSNDELTNWLKKADAAQSESAAPQAEASANAPEPFVGAENTSSNAEAVPDWLAKLQADASSASEQPATESASPAFTEDQSTSNISEDVPDWLKNLDAQTATAAPVEPTPTPSQPSEETPDWLKTFGATESAASAEPVAANTADLNMELPAWLKGEATEEPATSSASNEVVVPDWLKKPSEPLEKPASTPAPSEAPTTNEGLAPAEMPDWLSALRPAEEPPAESAPAFTSGQEENVFGTEPLSGNDLDRLFSSSGSDWLSGAASASSETKEVEPPAAQEAESISPANLPSWVQAMRPVEASLATTPRGMVGDETLETTGPLAGLHGVLPAVPFIGPSSKPKAQSIKLQPSEEQQGHAALLDQILGAESKPEPMATVRSMNSQRVLRLVLAILLLLVVAGAFFAGTQIFPMPLGRPNETMSALASVELVQQDAPVLVVVDYQPSLVGEMEAVAAPLLDHLIVLRHPELTLLSTSPTGAALAERLFTGPLHDLNYQSGLQYVNLGYLPGGLSGVRAFATDPTTSTLLTADSTVFNSTMAWQTQPLQGVTSLSNFAAIIVITDSIESGRTWIEQAGPLRGNAQFVIVSSAQAGPMFQPYYQSGQINGLMTGLYDSAVIEQNNANRPGLARRYWDSYNVGLLLAVVLVFFGSLWSLIAGLRERAKTTEAG